MTDFIKNRVRAPFSVAPSTEALIDFMLTKAAHGIIFFVNTPSKKPDEFLYRLGKKFFGQAIFVV